MTSSLKEITHLYNHQWFSVFINLNEVSYRVSPCPVFLWLSTVKFYTVVFLFLWFQKKERTFWYIMTLKLSSSKMSTFGYLLYRIEDDLPTSHLFLHLYYCKSSFLYSYILMLLLKFYIFSWNFKVTYITTFTF